MSKYGFTLVELAIVLVIIGLLVGAVAAGTELAEQSRINKQIALFNDLQRATTTFFSKYNGYPGDFNKATAFFPDAIISNGNGNKIVYCGNHLSSAGLASECKQFFNHLYITDLFTRISPTASGQAKGIDFPENPIGNNTATMVLTAPYPYTGTPFNPVSFPSGLYAWTGIVRDITTSVHNASARAWTSKHVSAIDTKIDDGNGLRGRLFAPTVYSGSVGANYGGASWSYNSLCRNDSTGVYNSVNENSCTHGNCAQINGWERCWFVYNFYGY